MKATSTVCEAPQAEQAERRRLGRYRHYTDLCIVQKGIGRRVELRSPDISAKGMFINTPHVFPLGASLAIRFHLCASGMFVRVNGVVRYCLEGVGIGVEFVDLSAEARAAIESECKPADW